MSVSQSLAVSALTVALVAPAIATAQQAMPQQQPPSAQDQVSQLDELVDLDASQEQELLALLENTQRRLQELESEARTIQTQLQEQVGADYDEASIRRDADRLGDLTGEMSAESVLMQARLQETLTQQQRDELESQMQAQQEQMRQMQEQMQQQQQQ
ncbi:hypothetical protein [Halomonas faecis]|uniref:hypothetical protein n=1 Tax=Halomonas faecis TaxID=1562110 RepID=UPI0013D35FEE|nr:hypothetical protein [Halomonas faecis]